MRPRALVVCGDVGMRRAVADALAAVGLAVDHAATPDAADLARFIVIVVDRAARLAASACLRAANSPVVVVGDDLDDDGLIALMVEAPVSHHVGDPGDRDLGITSEKLVTGDLFGLEKYVAPGSAVCERAVTTDADKRAAMNEVCAWAEGHGVRRPVLHRLASVVDELLMNALLDAPREARPREVADGRALLRWSCDERVLAVSVADDFGSLSQRDIIDHVRRARRDRGRPRLGAGPRIGAGLGLYLVFANVASLIVNVERGRRTEVVCLFDRPRRERPAVSSRVRSLHVFAAP
jgi:signal transduction histidine kinase